MKKLIKQLGVDEQGFLAGFPQPFAPYYQQVILPLVNQIRQRRKLSLQRFLIIAVVFVIVVSIAVNELIQAYHQRQQFYGKGAVFVSVAALLWYVALAQLRRFKVNLKTEIYPSVFKFFDPGYRYHADGLIPIEQLHGSALIPYYDDGHVEDYIYGIYKGVQLEFTEAVLKKFIIEDKQKRWRTVFRGFFIVLSLPKKLHSRIILDRDAGKLGNLVTDVFGKAGRIGLSKVKLEDPLFEQHFEVFANDQVEARYILTPSFMERLVQLVDCYGRGKIQASFYDNSLVLMVSSSKNRFEPSWFFNQYTIKKDINSILREMYALFQVIEVLKLQEQTGL